MLILANLLALALVVADEPPPAGPRPIVVTGELTGTVVAEVGWPLGLPEAIRISLENSAAVRLMPAVEGANLAIARTDAEASLWKFQADLMAHVRSVEQTYWALTDQNVSLWARETALRLGEAILERERANLEVGRGDPANVAEVEQQVEAYRLGLGTATAEVMAAEKQLRNLLGLPLEDGRRVIPSTAPTEARLEPDWEISVREMTRSQPDLVEQGAVVRLAELQLLVARNQLLPLMGPEALHEFAKLGGRLDEAAPALAPSIRINAARPYPPGMDPAEPREPEFIARQVGLVTPPRPVEAPRPSPVDPEAPKWESGGHFMVPTNVRAPLANARQAQYRLLIERATQRQILHQSTHSLARFFLEVDATYEQFRTASRLRLAAQQRLEAQQAFHEQGRITIDRLLDAVSQHANAIAQESLYKSTYNTSIAALEEAKGTLLAYDKIALIDQAAGPKPEPLGKRDSVVTATFDGPAPAPAPTPASTTYKIKAGLWGLKFLEVEVEVKATPIR